MEGYKVGNKKPPKNRQFGQPEGNPMSHGGWKKEDTPRYKLEQMMKLNEKELMEVFNDKKTPLFERKLAQAIAKGNWKEIEGMINQVYGTPKATTETKHVFDRVDDKTLREMANTVLDAPDEG